jgi:hypothetical protein
MEIGLRLKPDAGAVHHDFIMEVTRPDGRDFPRRCQMTGHGRNIQDWRVLATDRLYLYDLLAESTDMRSYCIATEGTDLGDELQ